MTVFKRIIQKNIEENLFDEKIIVLYGARQVGKTTLMKTLENKYSQKSSLFLNCDEFDVREKLTNTTSTSLKNIFFGSEMVFIDEAQRVENIGLTLKIAIDSMPEKQFIVSGSSSFDLANQINEPLTGRKYEFHLPPLSLEEISSNFNSLEQDRMIPQYLSFGLYPDIINKPNKAQFVLKNLVQGTLYKDILEHQNIRHSELLNKLLKALAFQVGQEVSYNELASLLKTNKATIERYIHLLEQAFVIFRLTPFSRNLRTELKKLQKIYFYDVGVRNALIDSFGQIELRSDIGSLWENFLVAEKLKQKLNHSLSGKLYFWRTHSQQEIDLVEEKNLALSSFEFKWNSKKKKNAKAPKPFRDAYPDASFKLVNPENYRDFLGL